MLRVLGFLSLNPLLAIPMYRPVLRWGTTLAQVRCPVVTRAVELARFLRQVTVWGMLTLGSTVVLAGRWSR